MHTYGKFGVVEIYHDGILREYIHKSAIEKAYPIGLELYSSKKNTDTFFSNLQEDFDNVFEKYEKIIHLPISLEMLHAFTGLSSELIDGYTRLDPLFTDKLFQNSKGNRELINNLKHINKRKDLFRSKISALFFENNNYLLKLRELFSEHFSVPAEDLRWYTVQDLENLLSGTILSQKNISARKLAFIQIGSDQGIENFFGKEALQMIKKFDSYSKPKTKTITGTVACKSTKPVVQGIVRIINANYQNPESVKRKIQLMKRGEILVAQTTSPNRMPACMKAGAIITDVGGVLSHAAIISREFDIPCIVGTEIASKILRDGDIVEVNTDQGSVRILN
jgi:phosphohistidine swiveling domain-containing protein